MSGRVISVQAIGAPHLPAPARLTPPPLSLYVHFPWCVEKCPYCDFNSHPRRGEIPETAYLDALIRDLEQSLPDIWGRRVNTIFFGGGTPSLISPAGIDRLLAAIRARVLLVPDAEVSLEANPGAIEHAALADYASAGITRLSLGVQSFNDRHLTALGRIHGSTDARAAAESAARHFATFNLDLMAALPGQTPAEVVADIDTALAFAPPHLSCYQLTLEPNTAFARTPPPDLPDEDAAAALIDAAQDRLQTAGYTHYETSAFCRPGHACRHNLNYWHYGDYLGLGAGAHGKLSFPDRGIRRDVRHRHPNHYLEAPDFVAESAWVVERERPFEFMMNALRLNAGVDAALFPTRTGLEFAQIAGQLDALVAERLLWRTPTQFGPTARGQRFLNAVLQRFL